jgi:hypothetical protein
MADSGGHVGIPLGKKAREAAESVKTAAKDASAFVWAVLGLACAALVIGAIALVRSARTAAA